METTSSSVGHMASLELVVNTCSLLTIDKTYTSILTGKHCCLWCNVASDKLKLAPSMRGPVQLRSDATLACDLAAFKADGSNIKRAKILP